MVADGICGQLVLTGMADKDLRCHGSTTVAERGDTRRTRIHRLIRYLGAMAFLIVQIGLAFFFVPGSLVGTITKRLVC
jgi:hypothetical protein